MLYNGAGNRAKKSTEISNFTAATFMRLAVAKIGQNAFLITFG